MTAMAPTLLKSFLLSLFVSLSLFNFTDVNGQALPDATQTFTGYSKMVDGTYRMISPDNFFILSASRNDRLNADDFGAYISDTSVDHGGITDWFEINVNPDSDLGSFELTDVFVGEYDYGVTVLRFEDVVISAYQGVTLIAETAPYASQSDDEETRYPIDYSVFEGKTIDRFRVTFTTKNGTPPDTFNLVEFTIKEASIEEPAPSYSLPTVSTSSVTNITSNDATLSGSVTDDGGDTVTERGFVYSLTADDSTPTVEESSGSDVTKVVVSGTTGVFNETISGLSASSQYSFAAYAINSVGTSYGSVEQFSTVKNPISEYSSGTNTLPDTRFFGIQFTTPNTDPAYSMTGFTFLDNTGFNPAGAGKVYVFTSSPSGLLTPSDLPTYTEDLLGISDSWNGSVYGFSGGLNLDANTTYWVLTDTDGFEVGNDFSNPNNAIYAISSGNNYVNQLQRINYQVTGIAVSALNSTPTDITLSSTSVEQSAGVNATVGQLSTVDPDENDTHTYSLVSGDGDTDNANFNISGNELRVNDSSSMASGDYSVRIQTNDGMDTYVKAFTISITASSSIGDAIVYVEHLKQGDPGIDRMGGASDPVVSPDGRHVYVAAYTSSAINIFSRNAASGELTPAGAAVHNTGGVQHMQSAFSVDISPDGKHVYVGSPSSHAVVVLARDENTGQLSFVESNVTANEAFTVGGFIMVSVSPDGKSVYGVGGSGIHGLVVFDRNPETGRLTYVEEHIAGQNGNKLGQGFSPTGSPINNIDYSAAGDYLYITSTANAVSVYARNTDTGSLTLEQVAENGINGVQGIQAASSLVVSPDENFVYVSGQGQNAVSVFSRDKDTGHITYVEHYTNGAGGISTMAQARSLAMSPDGRYLYVSAIESNAITVFERNIHTGSLSVAASRVNGQDGVLGIATVSGMVTDPLNQHLYSAGQGENAIAVFSLPIPGIVLASVTASADESGPAVTLDDQLLTFDSDDTHLQSGSVTIESGFKPGDQLHVTTQGGVTADYDADTGVLTLTGSATLETYRDILRSVSFQAGSDPDIGAGETAERTIAFRVNDGDNESAPAVVTVTVHGISGPAVVSLSPPHETTGVDRESNLSITFDKDFVLGSEGTLRLYAADDETPFAIFDLTDAGDRDLFSVSGDNRTLTLSHGLTFSFNETITVAISSGFVEDDLENSFPGFDRNSQTWYFTTEDLTTQAIAFTEVEEKTYGNDEFQLGPETSSEGLTVTYTAENEEVINISGNMATILKAGSTKITATQPGNVSVAPAEPVEQTVSIIPAQITVAADNGQSKTYGQIDPDFSYSATGFAYNDDSDIITGVLSRESGENVGTYILEMNDLNAGDNYTITFELAEFSITPATLAVTADPDQSKTYSDADPKLTFTSSGFAFDDDTTILSGTLTREPGEAAGEYLIELGSLDAGENYTIVFEGETFNILRTQPIAKAKTPENDEGLVAIDTPIVVLFDQDVDLLDVDGITLTDNDGESVTISSKLDMRELSLNPKGLQNRETYTVHIPAGTIQNLDGFANSAIEWSFTTIMSTPIVSDFSPGENEEDISVDSEIMIQFNQKVSIADEEGIAVKDASGNRLSINPATDGNSLIVHHNGFQNLTTYTVIIAEGALVNDDGVANARHSWSFSTIVALPATAELVTPVGGIGSIELRPELTWKSSEYAEFYNVQISSDSGFDNLILDINDIKTTTFDLPENLNSYSGYFWRVKAGNHVGNASWSETGEFYTIANLPEVIFPTHNSEKISTAPLLEWSSGYEETRFRVQLSDSENFVNLIADSLTTEMAVQITGLDANKTYFWRAMVDSDKTTSHWFAGQQFRTRPAAENDTEEQIVERNVDFGGTSNSQNRQISQMDYRMVGLPGADYHNLSNFFTGDYGKNWKAFFENGGDSYYYDEFDHEDERFVFAPGRGFWVLSTDILNLKLEINSVETNDRDAFRITVHPGWNIISNPHRETLSWQDVQELNGISMDLFGYDQRFTVEDSLRSVHGYYIYNDPNNPVQVIDIPYTHMGQRRGVNGNMAEKAREQAAMQVSPASAVISASFMNGHHFDVELVYSVSSNNEGRYLRYYPSLEMSQTGMMFTDDSIRRGGLIRGESTYNSEGEKYRLELKGKVGDKFNWEVNLTGLGDQARVLIINPVSNLNWMLSHGETAEVSLTEPHSTYDVYIGNESYLMDKQENMMPVQITLMQNYPNPFNPTTNIRYAIPDQQHVRLEVYDIIGRRVQVLQDGTLQAGWHNAQFNGQNLASGIYFYRLQTGSMMKIGRMTIIK